MGDTVGGASGPSQVLPEGEIPPVPEEIPDPLVRRTPITFREVEKYGPTPNCVGCEAKTKGEVTRRGPSEKCRRRMEELMRQDAQDKKKVEKEMKGLHIRLRRT